MERLDQIPWKDLTHAYGSAEDVPGLLRALKNSPPGDTGEDSPLWCLFGNIWHQGTVYEATSYAVPFLIEMAAAPDTSNRIAILELLYAIANGSSYLDVHGNFFDDPDFDSKKKQELEYVAKAYRAIDEGADILMSMTLENSRVALAAAHVLTQLPQRSSQLAQRLLELVISETKTLQRAGLVMLLGQTGEQSRESLSVLEAAATDPDIVLRRAAALGYARLKPTPRSTDARDAIVEAVLDPDLELLFDELPWDVAGEVDREELVSCLSASDREEIVLKLIAEIESGKPDATNVATLVNLLFSIDPQGRTPRLHASDLSAIQSRAIRAMVKVMDGGQRIFYGHFPSWGLPDTMREWRDLAAGREFTEVDMSLPLLAEPSNPKQALQPSSLSIGQSIHHRHFGVGIVNQIEVAGKSFKLNVKFEEEGTKTLLLSIEDSPE